MPTSIKCSHGKEAPEYLIDGLPISQAGPGRHRCAICAYADGLQDSLANSRVTEPNVCKHSSEAPTHTLEKLAASQAGDGRHKCTNCAYVLGYDVGVTQVARESLETELDTHGVFEDEYEPEAEGQRKLRLHITYERSQNNREEALKLHGTICAACGFDFDTVYGADFARHYIEVHHVESVTTLAGRVVTPATDLVPLCSNCHSMAHRERGRILTVTELQHLIESARQQAITTP
jgi:5-methylcytosine-specific restriction endonuclease McrA